MKTKLLILSLLFTTTSLLNGCCDPCDDKNRISLPQKYTNEDHLITIDQKVAMGKELQTQWWKLFRNKNLNTLIQVGINDNNNVAAAKAALAQAEQSVKSLRGSLWPQLSVVANAGRQKIGVALFGPIGEQIPPFTYYELGPILSWNVDIFGQTRNAVKQREALQRYQQHTLDAVYITLTSNIVAQSIEIAAAKAEIVAAKKIINEDEKNLKLIQQSFAAGANSELDILNAKTQLENDRTMLPSLQQRVSVAKHALAILVGKAPAQFISPEFELANFNLPAELPLGIPSQLLHRRPDILAAEDNLYAACAALGVAKSNFYPTLVLTANTLQEALTPGGLFDAVNNAFALAANLTAPIFQGGTLLAEKRKAEQAYQEMLANYRQTVLKAFQEVANSLTSLANDAKLIATERKAVSAARAALELSRKSFGAGTIGLLQIQAKQRELAQAELNLTKAVSQRYIDTAQLFVALGGSPI